MKGLLRGPCAGCWQQRQQWFDWQQQPERQWSCGRNRQANNAGTLYFKMENKDLFSEVVSYENIKLAFEKARKGKTLKPYVIGFEEDLEENLLTLRSELIFHIYKPKPLETFILRDPKTRKISKSDFRDRVVHHAIVNVIENIFDKTFIYDSYANRMGKGTLKAVERFDCFKRKVSRNNTRKCFILKADIKQYFENIDHNILISMIKKRINDPRLLWLIKVILRNHSGGGANGDWHAFRKLDFSIFGQCLS